MVRTPVRTTRVTKVVGVAVAAWALAACGGGGGGGDDGFPVNPGGGGPPGTGVGMPDARVDAPVDGHGDGGVGQIAARVCLVTDLRKLDECQATGADGFTVTADGATAITGPDGSFRIDPPSGGDWVISGNGVMLSRMEVGTSTVIPAITAERYRVLAITAGSSPPQLASGALVVRLRKAGMPLPNATVASQDAAQGTLYDGATDTAWQRQATSTFGVAWLPIVPTGSTTLVVASATNDSAIVPVAVEDQAIRFMTIAF